MYLTVIRRIALFNLMFPGNGSKGGGRTEIELMASRLCSSYATLTFCSDDITLMPCKLSGNTLKQSSGKHDMRVHPLVPIGTERGGGVAVKIFEVCDSLYELLKVKFRTWCVFACTN